MEVRRAERKDLPAVAELAESAALAPLGDLVPPGSDVASPRTDFTSLKRKLLSGRLIVCCDSSTVHGFADYEVEDDHLHIGVLAKQGDHLGVTSQLVRALRHLHPHLPISSDVVVGHVEEESLHESIGFVPGETVPAALAGHTVVARRWWLSPNPMGQAVTA